MCSLKVLTPVFAMGSILDVSLGGGGLACLPEKLVAKHIESGRLIRVLEPWCRPFSGFFLYYPRHRHTPTALRELIDFLKFELQQDRA